MYIYNTKFFDGLYPFGMQMPGRVYNAGNGYRYGFNGKEKDPNIDGNVYDYGFRIFNPGLGRFLSADPLSYSYPYFTPYQFAGNIPIAAIDVDGLEIYVVIYYKDQKNQTYKTEIRTMKSSNILIDQNVKKLHNGNQVGGKIAKGNVLVFEVYNEGSRYQITNINQERNTPISKLTPEEQKIYDAKNKAKEKYKQKSSNNNNQYIYPDNDDPQYGSDPFEMTDFYEATLNSPTVIHGFTSFTVAGFKASGTSWMHATKDNNGRVVFSSQLDDRLQAAKSNGNVQSITIVLDIYTQEHFTTQTLENTKKEYQKHASKISGISMDRIKVVGRISTGDSNKSSVIINTN